MSQKPSKQEEEYVARLEFERQKKIEAEHQKNLAEEDRIKLREAHYMKCPKCGMNLVEIDYKGILVDKCSECYGVWLDAGELESAARLEKGAVDKFFSVFK